MCRALQSPRPSTVAEQTLVTSVTTTSQQRLLDWYCEQHFASVDPKHFDGLERSCTRIRASAPPPAKVQRTPHKSMRVKPKMHVHVTTAVSGLRSSPQLQRPYASSRKNYHPAKKKISDENHLIDSKTISSLIYFSGKFSPNLPNQKNIKSTKNYDTDFRSHVCLSLFIFVSSHFYLSSFLSTSSHICLSSFLSPPLLIAFSFCALRSFFSLLFHNSLFLFSSSLLSLSSQLSFRNSLTMFLLSRLSLCTQRSDLP